MNKPVYIQTFESFKKIFGTPDNGEIPYVIFLGGPGSGKGTQAKELANKSGYQHVSTGDILRDSSNEGVKKSLKTGKLLPDSLVSSELKSFLKKKKNASGFIFDGYPRNIDQYRLLNEIAESKGMYLVAVFNLLVEEETLEKRIKKRGKTSGRADDKGDDVFKVRMNEFEKNTIPLIELIRQEESEKFHNIDGNKPLKDVTEKIGKIFLSSIKTIDK
jgi:adenylate kinase